MFVCVHVTFHPFGLVQFSAVCKSATNPLVFWCRCVCTRSTLSLIEEHQVCPSSVS